MKVAIAALHSELSEIGWHDYGAWAGEQLHYFRGLCPHPEPVAELSRRAIRSRLWGRKPGCSGRGSGTSS